MLVYRLFTFCMNPMRRGSVTLCWSSSLFGLLYGLFTICMNYRMHPGYVTLC